MLLSGGVRERLKRAVLKTAMAKAIVSSNLTASAKIENRNWKPKWGRAVGATQTTIEGDFIKRSGVQMVVEIAKGLGVSIDDLLK